MTPGGGTSRFRAARAATEPPPTIGAGAKFDQGVPGGRRRLADTARAATERPGKSSGGKVKVPCR